jgi:hypothetical protein
MPKSKIRRTQGHSLVEVAVALILIANAVVVLAVALWLNVAAATIHKEKSVPLSTRQPLASASLACKQFHKHIS